MYWSVAQLKSTNWVALNIAHIEGYYIYTADFNQFPKTMGYEIPQEDNQTCSQCNSNITGKVFSIDEPVHGRITILILMTE